MIRVESMATEIRPLREQDRTSAEALMAQAFWYPTELVERYRSWPLANHRGVFLDGIHRGGLVFEQQGQFFGGRRVEVACLFGVVIAPELRGRGLGRRLLESVLAEWRRSGVMLSTLYPATART